MLPRTQSAHRKSVGRSVRLGLLAGDGIGPEITHAAADIASAAFVTAGAGPLEWTSLPVGWEAIEKGGPALPVETVSALEELDAWLLGPVDFVSYPADQRAGRNPSGELRHVFDLYANVRPARNFPGVDSVVKDADLIIVRENSEGFYADRNMRLGSGDLLVTDGVALAVGVFTRAASERIAHVACQLAIGRRRHMTIVHKANVLPNSMGLYLSAAKGVAETYDIECDDQHVDAMAAHLVRRCADFDVVLCENLIGDVFSDLAGELTGSLGLAPSLNLGADKAMAQAAHGSAPDIAGQNIANPVGEILSLKMLVEWLGASRDDAAVTAAAAAMERAVDAALADGVATADVGGSASTSEFASEVVSRIAGKAEA
jgi:3-isopropylmalate dehydrogenase